MKRVVLGCLAVLVAVSGTAQTFAEWFKQNSTRLKYYAQQIAALQLYLGEMEKGFRVSDAGLSSISASKQGEYDLHQGYYASLGNINPVLGQLAEVTEIVTLQAAIIQRFSSAMTRYRSDGLLGPERLVYMEQVYSAVLQACLADAETLAAVLKTGNWQMTDDQRLGRINELDAAMRSRYSFTLAATDQADLLERQQAAEGGEIATVMGLYGIP